LSNGTTLSVSDICDSVNESTREISELMKLHIQGVWQMPINLLATESYLLQPKNDATPVTAPPANKMRATPMLGNAVNTP